jgi:hypothetical protein
MNETNFLVGCVTSILISLLVLVGACSSYDSYNAAEMIKAGADPVKVGCLFNTQKCPFVRETKP